MNYDELMHCAIDSDELKHYGVKGMKWGVRHDYVPVGYGNRRNVSSEDERSSKRQASSSGSSAKSSKQTISSNYNQTYNQNNQNHSKVKTALKVGAVVAGAALVSYGAYYLLDSGRARHLIAKGAKAIGKSCGFKKNVDLAKAGMSVDEIMSSVVSRINPGYGKFGTKNNCRRCTFAYEMSRRGYDVAATRTNSAFGQDLYGLYKATYQTDRDTVIKDFIKEVKSPTIKGSAEYDAIENSSLNAIKKTAQKMNYASDIYYALSKQPNGARGELSLRWKGGGGHSLAWEIINDRPVIFDCQSNTVYESKGDFAFELGNSIKSAGFSRLDNIELNEDFLLRWLRNA